MKSIFDCYSEHAIKVSDSYCSGRSSRKGFSPAILAPSVKTAVTCVHKVKPLNQKQLFVRIKWCNLPSRRLSVSICDFPLSYDKFRANSRFLSGSRGAESYESGNTAVEILWDFSEARFESGPEPISGFYVVVLLKSEVILILGDHTKEEIEIEKRVCVKRVAADSWLLSRSERFTGRLAVYSTRARFCDKGTCHDILIKCMGEEVGSLKNDPTLYIYVDTRKVVEVKRLKWNFRGNETIFLDGLSVDLMWDLHDWMFNSCSGTGIFFFRTRSGFDGRLWLEGHANEEEEKEENLGFSLLITACNNSD